MRNRRNYYRILHVQPDAPQALIKSSYRTLMQTLKQHPDLGGSHWNATVINEAYQVLSDPRKRQDYDEQIAQLMSGKQQKEKFTQMYCLFCNTPRAIKHTDANHPYCRECHSPLSRNSVDEKQLTDSRQCLRLPKQGKLQYYVDWPSEPKLATFIDLSPTGICILVKEPVNVNQTLKLVAPQFDSVMRALYCRNDAGGEYQCGGVFIDIVFRKPSGNFIKTQV